jgi:hypothetical protein
LRPGLGGTGLLRKVGRCDTEYQKRNRQHGILPRQGTERTPILLALARCRRPWR